MSRFQKSFSEDESIIAKTHKSFLSLIPIATLCVIVIAIVSVLLYVVFKKSEFLTNNIKTIIVSTISGIALLSLIFSTLSCVRTQAVITDYRLIFNKGVFIRKITEIPVGSVDNVHIKQGPIASLSGYGQLKIFTTSSMYSLKNISKVYNFKTSIMQTVVSNNQLLMRYQAKQISKEMQTNITL